MASDFLLKIDGIPGESNQDKHKGEIEVGSFSWGAVQQGSMSAGGGGGAGKASFNDLHFNAPVSKASPVLFQKCAIGEHIKKALLTVRKAGKNQQEYYKITLTDLLVSSFQSGGADGGGPPMDSFSLNYTKIEFSYAAQKADGTLEGAVIGKFNIKTGKPD